jgi:hypothetical protein
LYTSPSEAEIDNGGGGAGTLTVRLACPMTVAPDVIVTVQVGDDGPL